MVHSRRAIGSHGDVEEKMQKKGSTASTCSLLYTTLLYSSTQYSMLFVTAPARLVRACVRGDHLSTSVRGGTWGVLDPRNHSQHIVKSAAACATPGILSHLCSPFVNDPTGLTTSFFCVRAMRRGPVPTISSAFNTRTK